MSIEKSLRNIIDAKIYKKLLRNFDDIKIIVNNFTAEDLKSGIKSTKYENLKKKFNETFLSYWEDFSVSDLYNFKYKYKSKKLDYMSEFNAELKLNDYNIKVSYYGTSDGIGDYTISIDDDIYGRYGDEYLFALRKITNIFLISTSDKELKKFHKILLSFVLFNSDYEFSTEEFDGCFKGELD